MTDFTPLLYLLYDYWLFALPHSFLTVTNYIIKIIDIKCYAHFPFLSLIHFTSLTRFIFQPQSIQSITF